MKLLIYGILLLSVWMIPVRGTDVGKLIPVEVLNVTENDGTFVVRTDTGDVGSAQTLDLAFGNLKETAPGIIYLDTAEYLLLEPGMEAYMSVIGRYLKDSIRVCCVEEEIAMDEIADFLSVHEPGVKLIEAAKGGRIPTVSEENKRFAIK